MEIFPAEVGVEEKKYCRVCGQRVGRLYKKSGGKRCVVCLHRTHGEHMAENKRVCARCSREELTIPRNEFRPESLFLLHLSDMHFSRDGRGESANLRKWLADECPDYLLISGDLTAGAGREEYQRAADWIREVELGGIKVSVVPGNHDIGYWGNAASLGRQLTGSKYHRWIEIMDRPIEPCLRGPFFMSLGLNSAHGVSPTRISSGFLRPGQRARAEELLYATPKDHLRVVFCHHPLVRFQKSFHKTMFMAETVMREMLDGGADLILWGHQHSFATAALDKTGGKCIAVQGPTLSERTRDGGRPGFVTVRWFFGQKAVISAYRMEDAGIKEDKVVEYSLWTEK